MTASLSWWPGLTLVKAKGGQCFIYRITRFVSNLVCSWTVNSLLSKKKQTVNFLGVAISKLPDF